MTEQSNVRQSREQLQTILSPDVLHAVHHLRIPWPRGECPSGNYAGHWFFQPTMAYMKAFYDLVYHPVLLPSSKLPLDLLLAFDMSQLLPPPSAPEYLEQALGMVSILDQHRILTSGYAVRYTRCFFDPLCEKLVRQFIALPNELRPDGKHAWLSHGYSMDDWISCTIWFWAPLVHSDTFMTANRQDLKDWLHQMRAEVEAHSGFKDPFASLEAQDDVDILAFQRIESEGPPEKSYEDGETEAKPSDFAFWWIRILNAHFANHRHVRPLSILDPLEWPADDGSRQGVHGKIGKVSL